MENLAQHFTEGYFSKLLIESIQSRGPKVIVDLGIGDGALTTEAIKKWRYAKYYGVDLDNDRLKQVNKLLPNVTLHNLNSLDICLDEKIKIKFGTVDIAICNPPYITLKKTNKYKIILNRAGLNNSVNLVSYSSDLIFLAQNINLLRDQGTLGIIVPEGIICGHNFSLLRKDLIENHDLKLVIQLEPKIFKKTDAKTYILILNKGKSSSEKVELCLACKEGKIVSRIIVQKNRLEKRMDYLYHNSKNKNKNGKSLSEIGVKIQRGNCSKNILSEKKVAYFHTTHFTKDKKLKFTNNSYSLKEMPTIAKAGDILLARVGRNCYNKVSIISSGQIAITDCIFKISAKKEYRDKIYSKLNSRNGKLYLKKVLHGVCAQFISKIDLEELKIS